MNLLEYEKLIEIAKTVRVLCQCANYDSSFFLKYSHDNNKKLKQRFKTYHSDSLNNNNPFTDLKTKMSEIEYSIFKTSKLFYSPIEKFNIKDDCLVKVLVSNNNYENIDKEEKIEIIKEIAFEFIKRSTSTKI